MTIIPVFQQANNMLKKVIFLLWQIIKLILIILGLMYLFKLI
ncbi:hypothetical protein HMPREF9217_1254 [Lactobacillus iners LEAF 2052A-d]|nr:hypothetical protein HMPREF9217_1254 [Lactobacillus iners LEAF 2052A-d]DAS40556.1 MAG TPA: hypothetical protein [Caudoviricetes sp.]